MNNDAHFKVTATDLDGITATLDIYAPDAWEAEGMAEELGLKVVAVRAA